MPVPPGYLRTQLTLNESFRNLGLWNTWIGNTTPWEDCRFTTCYLKLPQSGIDDPVVSSQLGGIGYDEEYMDPSQLQSGAYGLNITAAPKPVSAPSGTQNYRAVSGSLNSHGKFNLTYGTNGCVYVQALARFPGFSGAWGGLWFLGSRTGDEADLIESGYTGHGPADDVMASNWHSGGAAQAFYDTGLNLTSGYNIYGIQFCNGKNVTMYFTPGTGGPRVQVAYYNQSIPLGETWNMLIDLQVANANTSAWHTVWSGSTSGTMNVALLQVFTPGAPTPPAITAKARASPPNGTAPLRVAFNGTAIGGTPPFLWTWHFGDGSSPAYTENPIHNFTALGTYKVTLAVGDVRGLVAKTTLNVSVVPYLFPLRANVTALPQNLTLGRTALIEPAATDGALPYTFTWTTSYAWCAASGRNLSCTPTAPGKYLFEDLVADAAGERVVAETNLTVAYPAAPPPTLSLALSPPSVTPTVPVKVAALVSGGLAPVTIAWATSYPWCSPTLGTHNLTCQPPQPGRFLFEASATDAEGRVSIAFANLTVTPPTGGPLAIQLFLSPTPATVDQSFELVAEVQGGLPPYSIAWTVSYSWCSPAGTNLSCLAQVAGTYPFQAEVSDASSTHAYAEINVTVVSATSTGSSNGGAQGAFSSFLLLLAVAGISLLAGIGIAAFFWRRKHEPQEPPGPEPTTPPMPSDPSTGAGMGMPAYQPQGEVPPWPETLLPGPPPPMG